MGLDFCYLVRITSNSGESNSKREHEMEAGFKPGIVGN